MVTFAATEATEGSPMGGGDIRAPGFRLCALCCIPLQPPVAHVNKPKVLVAS
jgi:hypothetical protein